MKILCWNSDDAVWHHWKKVVEQSFSLTRVSELEEVASSLESEKVGFTYLFVFLDDKNFSKKVEDVVLLRQQYPEQKVIVFPNQPSQTAALRLFSMGVDGQCSPYIGKEQLALALSVIDSGEIWGGRLFIQNLIAQSTPKQNPNVSPALLKELSERELSVARFISSGLSNKQIAYEMEITERTVKAHLTTIFKKTKTRDRLSLALLVQSVSALH